MRKLTESDIFSRELDKRNNISGKIDAIISGAESSTVILNEKLYSEIKRKIVDKKRDELSLKMLNAISSGGLILFTLPPEKRLSTQIPFIICKLNGVRTVAVNMCDLVVQTKYNDGSIEYELGDNVNKVYVLLQSSYLELEKFDERSVMSPDVLYESAVLWAEMFNKPLYDAVGLNNSDRYSAYLYFSMKFFLVYFMGCTEAQAESMASKRVPEKNMLLLQMIDVIESRDLNIYEGVIPYLKIILDNEVASTKGIRVNNLENSMNISHYLMRFIQSYSDNALLSLCAFPYFIYTIQSAYNKTKMMKDKSFDWVFDSRKGNLKLANKLMTDILK